MAKKISNTDGNPWATADVSKERDVRIHSHLWHSSLCLLERGQEQEKASAHQHQASLVFTAFALEAYLNWIGRRKNVSDWDKYERLGPKRKLQFIAKHVGVSFDFARRPASIVVPLFGFRNDIAHGKPATLTYRATVRLSPNFDRMLGQFIRTKWERFCTERNALRAREDVYSIARKIHEAAALPGESSEPFLPGMQSHSATLGFR